MDLYLAALISSFASCLYGFYLLSICSYNTFKWFYSLCLASKLITFPVFIRIWLLFHILLTISLFSYEHADSCEFVYEATLIIYNMLMLCSSFWMFFMIKMRKIIVSTVISIFYLTTSITVLTLFSVQTQWIMTVIYGLYFIFVGFITYLSMDSLLNYCSSYEKGTKKQN